MDLDRFLELEANGEQVLGALSDGRWDDRLIGITGAERGIDRVRRLASGPGAVVLIG